MSCLIDSTFVRYAAIKTCCSQDSPEPLIIAYSNERSLRELIASPSILGLGFDSRVRPEEEYETTSRSWPFRTECPKDLGLPPQITNVSLKFIQRGED